MQIKQFSVSTILSVVRMNRVKQSEDRNTEYGKLEKELLKCSLRGFSKR